MATSENIFFSIFPKRSRKEGHLSDKSHIMIPGNQTDKLGGIGIAAILIFKMAATCAGLF